MIYGRRIATNMNLRVGRFFQCQKDSWQNGDRDDRSDGIDVDVGCQCNYCGEGAVEINVVVEKLWPKVSSR
jgi:hypothetical protein